MSESMNQTAKPAPIKPSARIEVIDILRGFAIFGVLVMNMGSYTGSYETVDNWSWAADRLVNLQHFLFEAKFYSMLSILFGLGMSIQMLRAEKHGTRFLPLFLRRMFILFLIGLAHATFLWTGDILLIYALCGVLLLFFRKLPPKIILIVAFVVLLHPLVISLPQVSEWAYDLYGRLADNLRPLLAGSEVYTTGTYFEVTLHRFWEGLLMRLVIIFAFGNIFSMFLLGLYLGRRQYFQHLTDHLRGTRRLMWISLALGLALNALYVYGLITGDDIPEAWRGLSRRGVRTLAAPSLAFFYMTAVILLSQKERWQKWLAIFAPVGRMALTNYLAHSLVLTTIFYGYGLNIYGEFGPIGDFILSLTVFALQVKFSRWWLEHYRFGPAEWLWRSLTYGRLQPWHLDADPAARPSGHKTAAVAAGLALLLVGFLWQGWQALPQTKQAALGQLAGVGPTATFVPPTPQPTPTPTPVLTPVVQPVNRRPAATPLNLRSLALTFDPAQALTDIEILTGPAYQGRQAGSPGGQAAADYIAQRFADYGLRPAGLNGTYFQPFALPYPRLTDQPALTITAPDGHEQAWSLRRDFAPLVSRYMGGGVGNGPVLWLNNCAPADFDLVDAVGKIAFCWDRLWLEGETDPGRNALEHGAAGLLLLSDPTDSRPLDQFSPYREVWVAAPLPAARISPTAAQALLTGSSLTMDDLTLVFAARPLSTTARLSIPLNTDETAQGRNVLALLPGQDPAHRDELVILGAHYDHLGADPAGAFWPGANDNASGVAAMLEIARSWQAGKFMPRRSVLFAAWDGREVDSAGAAHYVEQPQFPLTNTVTIGLLNLDMIGAGDDTLYLDGSGPIATQAQGIAQSLGITITGSYNHIDNDHTPFAAAKIPVTLLSWVDGEEPEKWPAYHRPTDTAAAIEPDKLGAAGRLANLTLLALANGEPAIRDVVEKRVQAINNGNQTAFLQTGLPQRAEIETDWFDGIQNLTGAELTVELSGLQITGSVATAMVQMTLESGLLGQTRHSARTTINFVHQADGWRWAGPPLANYDAADGFALAYPPAHTDLAPALSRRARLIYDGLANRLGLPGDTPARLILYPDSAALRADTGLTLPATTDGLVDNRPGQFPIVKLAYTPAITRADVLTTTLTQLLLTEAGVSEDDAPWLWQGLPLVLNANDGAMDGYKKHISSLRELFVVSRGGQASSLQPSDSRHWAAVEFLRQEIGWAGIGQLIRALGQGLPPNQAMTETVGYGLDAFEDRWQDAWRKRLTESQRQITTLLEKRQQAVLAQSETDFLATVDPADPTLLAEERAWLADLAGKELQKFELSGQPVAFLPDGSTLIRLTMTSQLAGDARPIAAPLTIRLVPTAAGYRWAGPRLDRLETEHFVIRHPTEARPTARLSGQMLETAYQALAERLPPPAEKITVKLYPNHHSFRASVGLSAPGWLQSWTGPQQSLKLLLNDRTDPVDYQIMLTHQLARQWLAVAANLNWLDEGLALVEAAQTDRGLAREIEQQYIPRVIKLIRRESLFSLTGSPGPDQLTPEEIADFYAQSWDTVRFLIDRDGPDKLEVLRQQIRQGQDVATAFAAVYGQPLANFAAEWRASATRLHLDPALVDVARTFAVTNTEQSIFALTRPEFNGRQPGTAGALAAAQHIATRFDELGLTPAGDDGTFFQRFPITYTALTAAPQLLPLNKAGEPIALFRYRHDFITMQTDGAGGGQLEGDVVWIRGDVYGPVRLTGKVVLRRPVDTLEREIAQAIARDAAGLILVEKLTDDDLQAKRLYPEQPPPAWVEETGPEQTIPVVRLSNEAFERLLAVGGYAPTDVNNSPPAMPLDLRVRLAVPLTEQTVTAANVLALLPGREPTRQHEIIVVGAHYDHVGNDPADRVCLAEGECFDLPGFAYPGANDDASAVGLLLETIRLWRENGYQPARSILFAVWGAEELAEAGAGYYIEQPTRPLTYTVAMVQLEAIGGGRGFWLQAEGNPALDQALRLTFEAAAQAVEARLQTLNPVQPGGQAVFQERGIPSLLIHWENASALNLPAEADDEIKPERLKQSGETVTLGLMMLSEH